MRHIHQFLNVVWAIHIAWVKMRFKAVCRGLRRQVRKIAVRKTGTRKTQGEDRGKVEGEEIEIEWDTSTEGDIGTGRPKATCPQLCKNWWKCWTTNEDWTKKFLHLKRPAESQWALSRFFTPGVVPGTAMKYLVLWEGGRWGWGLPHQGPVSKGLRSISSLILIGRLHGRSNWRWIVRS